MAEITATGVIALAAVGVGAMLYFKRGDIASAVGSAAQAVNPLSDQNMAYRGANAAVQAITGDTEETFGGWLFEKFNDIPPLNGPDLRNLKSGYEGAQYFKAPKDLSKLTSGYEGSQYFSAPNAGMLATNISPPIGTTWALWGYE